MSYTTTVFEIDGELAIIIPPEVMEALDLQEGDALEWEIEDDRLILRKAK